MRLRQGPAKDREILGEDIDGPPIDGAPPRDDAIARVDLFFHAKVCAPVGLEHVGFLEGAFVEE